MKVIVCDIWRIPMSKFNFEEWKDKKVVMHCETKEEAEDFCRVMHEAGLKWRNGESYKIRTRWDCYKTNTVYHFNTGLYGRLWSAFEFGFDILEWSDYMNKPFTKSDLKNGDVCVCRNGKVYCAIVDYDSLTSLTGYNRISDYNQDFTEKDCCKEFDIVKVYRPKEASHCSIAENHYEDGKLMFDRTKEEPVEVTLEEIAKLKGVSVEQIKIVEKK